MSFAIKELRKNTGMSQTEFAKMYEIPVSTLRKWEQGEASPASYFVKLLARSIPAENKFLRCIKYSDGTKYYYDKNQKIVYDIRGNGIKIKEDLDGVKEQNLGLYLHDLFEGFYVLQEKFEQDCIYDKEDNILWT